MDYRVVVLAVAVLGTGFVSLTTSCSAPDPGEVTFMERPRSATSSGDPVPPSSSSGGDAGGSSSSGDGGGSSTSGGPVTAFSGAPAFAQGQAAGTSTQPANHAGGPNNSNAFINCQDCHKTGGASPWAMAGTVATDAAGSTPVVGAEVRMVDSTGKQLASVYTDTNGNFWIDAIPNGIPAGAKVGVRNATSKMEMGTAMSGVGDGACNKAGCHVSGGQGHIYLK